MCAGSTPFIGRIYGQIPSILHSERFIYKDKVSYPYGRRIVMSEGGLAPKLLHGVEHHLLLIKSLGGESCGDVANVPICRKRNPL